ncbi:MAG: hypothetical protein ACK554_09965 [Erythrobacteraceae bacterium]
MPEGDWRIWMIMVGRGFGKTRAGAEWVRQIAEFRPPGSRWSPHRSPKRAR